MKIAITNTAALNTGDAAILLATVDILRQMAGSHLEVTVFDQQASAASRYYPDFDFQPELFDQVVTWAGTRWTKAGIFLLLTAAAVWRSPLRWLWKRLLPSSVGAGLDRFAAADLVVSAGGTYLVPHYRIFPKILDLLVARSLRRPFVLFTQSLGPFPKQRRDWLLRHVLRRARVILVRDARSRRHLVEFGVSAERIALCADAVFAMAPLQPPAPVSGRAGEGPLRVAISVRDWPHIGKGKAEGMADYHAAVAELVRRLVETHGAEVTFLSTCQGALEYWTDDSRVADSVVALLSAEVRRHVRINRDFHTPQALLDLYGRFDLVVATRMHAAILALCAGVPVLPVAYEFKTVELFTALGLGDYVQSIETLSGERLCRAADRLLADRSALRASLPARVARARCSAFAAGGYVTCALEKAAP
ncbi:MAG: polysaccharide pyruvyl transferase family protein [Rhodospirillales bacterium]|nr:polysaccharide pyruvyl transferase family protein [Rhodospirillales bacterium]